MLLHGTDSFKKKQQLIFSSLKKKNDRTAPQMRFGMVSTCYHLKKNIDSFLAAPAAFVVV